MRRKPRVGKNEAGWYVAVPQWTGAWDVLEGFASFEDACAVAFELAPRPFLPRPKVYRR
jgi:hypothetical protein